MSEIGIIVQVVSLVLTIGTICICIGVYKTKLEMCERNIKGIGEKLSNMNKEIREEYTRLGKEIRDEHIKPLKDKMGANYSSLIQTNQTLVEFETVVKEISKRFEKIEAKMERNL
jgi:gas vesicle protein